MEFGTREYIDFLIDGNDGTKNLASKLTEISDDDSFVSGILLLVGDNLDDVKKMVEYIEENDGKLKRTDIIYYAVYLEQNRAKQK